MPEARVTHVGGSAHQGDIHVVFNNNATLNNIGVLVECKNYTQTVPKSEVDKFIEDMRNS
jgi:hypothetical protein